MRRSLGEKLAQNHGLSAKGDFLPIPQGAGVAIKNEGEEISVTQCTQQVVHGLQRHLHFEMRHMKDQAGQPGHCACTHGGSKGKLMHVNRACR